MCVCTVCIHWCAIVSDIVGVTVIGIQCLQHCNTIRDNCPLPFALGHLTGCVSIKHLHMGVNRLPHFLLSRITDWASTFDCHHYHHLWVNICVFLLDSTYSRLLPYVHPLNHLWRCPELMGGEECSVSRQTGLLYVHIYKMWQYDNIAFLQNLWLAGLLLIRTHTYAHTHSTIHS